MFFLFIAAIFISIAFLITRKPETEWTFPIYWAYFISAGCGAAFIAMGLVIVLFK